MVHAFITVKAPVFPTARQPSGGRGLHADGFQLGSLATSQALGRLVIDGADCMALYG